MGKKYGEALAAIQYGILANKGFISLTGDVGTGKTTIANALVERLGSNIIFAKIPDPSLNSLDFFNFTANAFEMNKTFNNKGDFLRHLNTFLNNAHDDDKKVTLIIEEAQRLNEGLLEEIRLLSNIEKPNKKLINILFLGQNEFNDLLKTNKALRHRITISCRIEPLTEIETEKYILHRLKIAGSKRRIFSTDAVQEIFFFTGGNPRLINIICDLALLSGYVQETKNIESAIIRECTANVLIPNQQNTEAIKDPKAFAKTVQKTRIKEIATLRDVNSEVAEKVLAKPARNKVLFLAAISLLILIGILGYNYYYSRDSALIGKFQPVSEQSLNHQPVSSPEPSSLKSQTAEKTASGSDITKLWDNQGQQEALIPQANKAIYGLPEVQHLQSQLLDLEAQRALAEKKMSRLISRNDKLAAELKEMQVTKERVAELENAINKREKVLPELEQKLKELENTLNQEKNRNNILMTDLSAKAALVLELQKKLEASRSSHDKLEDEVAKSKNEIVQLEDQLSDLKTKQASATASREVLKMHRMPSLKGGELDEKAESPNPADIIDWVIKKKSK
jgi:type II secretory pathway predicted ATPase ExeA/predicted  nucleic acid-binding Zn-ribbon protein